MRAFKLLLALVVLCFAPAAFAQDDCPMIVATALEMVDAACNDLARNQLCYGNTTVNITPREGVADLQFQQSGDTVGITDVASVQLSAFGLASAEWGVALMKVQANLPDTLPGQNVTFLLFGDVSLIDASEPLVERPVTATRGVNVRALPATNAGVIKSLGVGEEVVATGRLADSSWVRVRLDMVPTGWVSADFLSGDLQALLPSEPGTSAFGPMQVFYFTSGLADAPCAATLDSGILIQTPAGAGTVQLRANDVDIQLGSTVYLQAVPGDAMYVSVLEGHATLTAQGHSQVVPPGTVGRVPLGANGAASGPPEYPVPYAFQMLRTLPVSSQLLTPIEVRRATARANIDDAIADIVGVTVSSPAQPAPAANPGGATQNNGQSGSGQWVQNEIVTFTDCPGPLVTGSTNMWYPTLVYSPDRQSFTYDGGPNNTTVTLGRTGDAVYQGVFDGEAFTFTFTSPTTYHFLWVGVHGDPNNGGCRFVMDADASLISGSPW